MKLHRSQQARRRTNLWRANPHCHWCNVLTVPPEGMPIKGQPQPDNLATLDHLRSRLNEERIPGRQWPHGSNTVLACHKCNAQRNTEEMAAAPIEELHRRSGRGRHAIGTAPCFLSFDSLDALVSAL